jgi:hypothetical protein
MGSPFPTSPSSLTTRSTSISLNTPTSSPAPTLPFSTPSPAPVQYPEPPDEFVQDHITYLNRAKTTKAARPGSSHVWKYGLHYIRDSDKKEVYYCHECAVGKYKQELFVINGTSGVRNHLEQKHQIDPRVVSGNTVRHGSLYWSSRRARLLRMPSSGKTQLRSSKSCSFVGLCTAILRSFN